MDDQSRWQHLQQLFHQARVLPTAARAVFLDSHCRDHPELLAELRQLLAGDEATGPLDAIVGEALRELASQGQDLSGALVGPYRLVRLLAHGGMGMVYLAERADGQFEKQVAIKLVSNHLATADLRHWFDRERRILAQLEHAHIARLLDGGTTDDGLPYLIMENVEGQPLDQYCNDHRLGLRARLRLFSRIARAVLYAHQHLVVHCDLKMSNILVTETGEPRLLDFGIARLMARDEGRHPASLGRHLTLNYCSPEQVLGKPLNLATDIYTLGVILYELLTGQSPYRGQEQDPRQLARAVAERQPLPPSEAVGYCCPDGLYRSPGQARRALKGDLDCLVCKALDKDPADRYSSIAVLLDDLGRYFDGQPLLAHPQHWQYRAGKWLGRNPLGAALAMVIVLAAVTTTGVLAYKNRQVMAQRDLANQERARAEAVSGFLTGMFEHASPEKAQGREISARDVLNRASTSLDDGSARQLMDQPQVAATLRRVMGSVYLDLGLLDEAGKQLDQALATLAEQGMAEDPEYLQALLAKSRHLGLAFRHDQALALDRQALVLSRRLYGEDSPHTLNALSSLAVGLHMTGNLEEAAALFEEVWQKRRTIQGERHPQTLHSLAQLGVIFHWLGRYEQSEHYYRACLEGSLAVLGETHPRTLRCMSNLGSLLETVGRFEEAAPLIHRHLVLASKVLGKDHLETLRSMHNLADTQRGLGHLEQAEQGFLAVLARRRQVLGDGHIETLQTQMKLARLYRQLDRFDEAQPLVTDTLARQERKLGFVHPTTLIAAQEQADLYYDWGRYRDADVLYQRVLAARETALGQAHPDLINTLAGLARTRLRLGEGEQAEALVARACALRAHHPGLKIHGFNEAMADYARLNGQGGMPGQKNGPDGGPVICDF
ncbi:serine/threonine-protein kinase [Gallaecimonas sp. GXIMD4217]|uniref:serine/threonine-protein kinase n=1 Tax=Gallaecimonas sp. GXIMD4217 TaxID=3131927 RepID=UPI00311B0BBB